MKTYVHLWKYLDEFLFERDVSDKSCRENQNIYLIFNKNILPESRAFNEIM